MIDIPFKAREAICQFGYDNNMLVWKLLECISYDSVKNVYWFTDNKMRYEWNHDGTIQKFQIITEDK